MLLDNASKPRKIMTVCEKFEYHDSNNILLLFSLIAVTMLSSFVVCKVLTTLPRTTVGSFQGFLFVELLEHFRNILTLWVCCSWTCHIFHTRPMVLEATFWPMNMILALFALC